MFKNFNFENITEDYLKRFKHPTIEEFSILENKYNSLTQDFANFGIHSQESSSVCFNALYNITINEETDNFNNIVKYIYYISKIDFIFLNKLNSFLLKIPIIDYWTNSFLNKCNLTLNSIFSSIYDIEQTISTEIGFINQHITDITDIKNCFSYSIRNLELDLFALYFKQIENKDDAGFLENINSKIYSINLARLNLVNSLAQTILIENRLTDLINKLNHLQYVTLPIFKNTLTIVKNMNKNNLLNSKYEKISSFDNISLNDLYNTFSNNVNNKFINPYLLNQASKLVEQEIIDINKEKNENHKKNVDFFKNTDIIYKLK